MLRHADLTPDTLAFIAADLVRSLRGRRSQTEFSRRIGYRSNVAHRWESGACWPTAAAFLKACARVRPESKACFTRFFSRAPDWLDRHEPFTPESVARFLSELRGKAPIGALAERTGYNRYSVGRWLRGTAQPKLPEFLALIEASSRRLLDFIAGLTDPSRMATIAPRWKQLQAARAAAYESPWSHAVLRALELGGARRGPGGERWIAARLGLPVAEVRRGLEILAATGQIRKARGRWRLDRVISVDTSQDVLRARALKAAWTGVALDRLRAGAPGSYGYSLFAVSRADLRRLRELHLEYLRAMQSLIAESTSVECVGLYCAQLLDLGSAENALAPRSSDGVDQPVLRMP